MKRVISAAVLMFVIMVLSAADCLTVVKITRITENNVSAVCESCLSQDRERSQELAEIAEQNWYSHQKLLSLMIHSDQLEEISSSLSKIKHLIADDSDEVSAELNSIICKLRILRRDEIPCWYNIL